MKSGGLQAWPKELAMVTEPGLLSCKVRYSLYGTTVLVVIRRSIEIVTPYFTVITVKYGTVYDAVPC
jgi:hypothetical protein